MPINLEGLNENQRKAVLWDDGPLLVLAGPGSGKTRVLTFRVARLLEENEDVSVLALTFTSTAAAEMRERVDALLGHRAERAHLCTFHSFATDVLRQHGSHLGIQPDFSLITQKEDRMAILDEVIDTMNAEARALPSDRSNLLTLIDRLFAESYEGGATAPSLTHTPPWVPSLFEGYCDALVAMNRLDFGSLLSFTYRLLREKKGVARVIRLGWTHVCVDEFQDTNKAQYDLLKLIAAEQNPNLFVVGDDDQIIYQWNGASPERLQSLRTDFGGTMEMVQLPENYRCPHEIVALANKLIVHNQMRTPGKQPLAASRAVQRGDPVIRGGAFDTPDAEVIAVAAGIAQRLQAGASPTDIAVLGRTTKLLESAARAIQAAGLEAYVARRKNDFSSPVVQVVFQALRLANARHDRDVLRRLCLAWATLADTTVEVEDVVADATLIGGDFLRAWADAAQATEDAMAGELVGKLRSTLVERLDFPGVVDWFLAEGKKAWSDEKDTELADELETWDRIHGEIVAEHGHDDLTLHAYLQQMDLAPKTALPSPNAIRCMTVHGSKGLEFKHVYLIGMAQEVLPSFQALRKGADSREVEEERRNCFVAITRVQETLTLTRSRQYHGWSKEPSQFLAEMGLEVN
jgi:DNA helicase II / ATP-dependent DNA helicase PcrA